MYHEQPRFEEDFLESPASACFGTFATSWPRLASCLRRESEPRQAAFVRIWRGYQNQLCQDRSVQTRDAPEQSRDRAVGLHSLGKLAFLFSNCLFHFLSDLLRRSHDFRLGNGQWQVGAHRRLALDSEKVLLDLLFRHFWVLWFKVKGGGGYVRGNRSRGEPRVMKHFVECRPELYHRDEREGC